MCVFWLLKIGGNGVKWTINEHTGGLNAASASCEKAVLMVRENSMHARSPVQNRFCIESSRYTSTNSRGHCEENVECYG